MRRENAQGDDTDKWWDNQTGLRSLYLAWWFAQYRERRKQSTYSITRARGSTVRATQPGMFAVAGF